jgi:uncharacterized protein (TIGR00369 family)
MIGNSELEEILKNSPFMHEYGFQLESFGAGTCSLRWKNDPKFLRPDGIVSGPVYMAAADTAMWIAIMSRLGPDGKDAVTTEMKTNFLATHKPGEDFWCTARVIKTGERIVFGVAECVTLDGALLTHHTMSYIRRTK